MLEVIGLGCTRGDRMLFREVSFTAAARSLIQIAGTNGSGKTSLLRIVCGLGAADAGEVRWNGEPIGALREAYTRELAYIGHANALKDDLSAIENLQVACVLAGRPASASEIDQALGQFGLAACAHLPVRALSQGQKRRASLARLALSPSTPLWILDEPFSALDAAAVRHLEQLIMAYVDGGGVALFTTHQDGSIAARVSQRVDLDLAQGTTC